MSRTEFSLVLGLKLCKGNSTMSGQFSHCLEGMALNESDTGWLTSAGTSVFRPINLDQLRTVTDRFISGNEDTLHCFVFFFLHWSAPRSAWKNTACLVTYLIATGHHLCVRFALLVFQAQTRLISWLALIRGHISEHSRVSHAACWEKWNAINQSGLLFNVLDSGNKQNADWVSDVEIKFIRCTENKYWKPVKHCRRAFVEKFSKVYWSQAYFSLLHQQWYIIHSS